jgi:hypothetical protein
MKGSDSMDRIIDHRFKSVTSFSHLLGCVTALIVDYIRSAYGDNFFKTIRCTSEVPFSERRNFLKLVLQKPRPAMIIDCKYDIGEDAKFLPMSEFYGEIPNEPTGNLWIGANNGTPLITDPQRKYQLLTKGHRYKLSYSIKFLFDSDVQRMQSQEFIRQNIRHGVPILVQRFIENNIPNHFMQAIASIEGMDINSQEFISFLNTVSEEPITYRIRPGSGNKEFFCLSPVQMDVLFTSPPSNDGAERKGNIITSASFTEEIDIEFPAYSTYFLRTNVDITKRIDMSQTTILHETTMKSVARFTVAELPTFNDYENGWKKVIQLAVQADAGNETNKLCLDQHINGEIRRIVNYYRKQSLGIDFLRAAVAEGSKRIDGSRFSFDPNTLTVSVENMDPFKIYHIAIYADNKFINDFKQSVFAYDQYQEILEKNK